MNVAATTNLRLEGTEFQSLVSSIQYRLLWLHGVSHDDDHLAECLRLAMLAFLATTSETPGKTSVRYSYLANQFCAHCLGVDAATPGLRALMFWALMVSAVAAGSVDERWLCERWRVFVPESLEWPAARHILQGFIWIDAIHDEDGRSMFEVLDRRRGYELP